MHGWLLLANTRKEFLEEVDRKALLVEAAEKLWTAIETGKWMEDPSLLQCFYLTAWAVSDY